MKNTLDFFKQFDFSNLWFDDFSPIANSPKVNIKETDEAFEIEIANPGFNKDDTEITIKNHIIYVVMKSESNEDNKDNDKYHVKQWSKASYSESWNIPDNVIEDKISAKANNGVLVITLPKRYKYPNEIENPRIVNIS